MALSARFLQVLRDPLWQFVGVLITLGGLWAATASTSKNKAVLSVYHFHQINFEDYRLPTDRIRLVLNGSNEEISRAVVDYYVIINRSDKPILPADVSSPLTISKASNTKKIFLVATCSENPAERTNTGTGTSVAVTWSQSGEKWSAQPSLFNPGDYSCATVISEEGDTADKAAKNRFKWDGRIVNIQLQTFDSYEEYAATLEQKFTDYIGADINMSGYTPYWFAAVQLLLFFGTMTLARKAAWITSLERIDLLKSAGVVAIATGSAESLTSLFTLPPSRLHPAVPIFLLLHLVLAIAMYRSAKKLAAGGRQLS